MSFGSSADLASAYSEVTASSEAVSASCKIWTADQLEVVHEIPRLKLGEGPLWIHERLHVVDIIGKRVYRYDPKTGNVDLEFDTPSMVGSICPFDDNPNRFLLGLEDGIYEWNRLQPQVCKLVLPLERDLSQTRFNDGRCDADGRFWVGSMDFKTEKEPVGTLYRIEGKELSTTGHLHLDAVPMLPGVTVANGLGWSSDRRTFYYIDSTPQTVSAYHCSAVDGSLSSKRIIRQFQRPGENPDGMCIDSLGRLWVAHWMGACVSCMDPSTGEILQRIQVPSSRVTSCRFVGTDLYITTSSLTVEDTERYAGHVFVMRGLDCSGVEEHGFRT